MVVAAAMREAIAKAEVGDDVYGEDPTVNRLQETAARRLGKEAALFVPSGSMGNQISLRVLGRPGDVVLAGANAHVLLYEAGAPAALSGLQIQELGDDGLFDGDDVRAAIHPPDSHYAPTRVAEGELFLFRCPMAEEFGFDLWVQEEEDIANPYMGQSMPRCGKSAELN